METGRDFFQHKTVRRARDKGGLAIRLYKWEKVLDTILVFWASLGNLKTFAVYSLVHLVWYKKAKDDNLP